LIEKILVVADPLGSNQSVVDRAVALARTTQAELLIVGFVYEHIANLADAADDGLQGKVRDKLLAEHRKGILEKLRGTKGKGTLPKHSVEVHWEKRVADWVISAVAKGSFDLVVKRVHRSETMTYTPTDWQLLRGCRCSVLLVAEKRWKKSDNVLAAVDLGTRARSKRALNLKVVTEAHAFAQLMNCQLIVSYALPVSRVLRDLDIVDEKQLRRQARARLDEFCRSLEKHDITVDAQRLVTGAPEKALVNAAAKSHAGLVVLGCVGRKRLAGRVIGNTAEQILRLAKADVLAVKPS
jgi:universal stress protein E